MDMPSIANIASTNWVERLRAGAQPSPDDLRQHLLTVHEANAGFTEACAARCHDGEGRTSYEWLAEAVPVDAMSVLDLACGSGPLLSLLTARHGPQTRLIGVDMSESELGLAATRVPPGRVEFHCGLAQNMPYFADGSIHTVLCHWALTLMDPVEPVLREVRRVLRPGGRFAAIIDGPADIAPLYQTANRVIYDAVQQSIPHYGAIDMGDPRVRSADALRALAGAVFGRDAVTIQPSVVSLTGAPADVAAEAAGFFYASFVLPEDERALMLAALADALTDDSGQAQFDMPINRLVVQL